MKLIYKLTIQDYFIGRMLTFLCNRAFISYMMIFVFIISILDFSRSDMQYYSIYLYIASFISNLIVYAIVFVIVFIVISFFTLLFSKGEGIVCDHELEISDEGLTESTNVNKSLHKWKGVKKISEVFSYVFIRINEAGGAMHIIPRNKVLDGDIHSFIAEIKRRISLEKKA